MVTGSDSYDDSLVASRSEYVLGILRSYPGGKRMARVTVDSGTLRARAGRWRRSGTVTLSAISGSGTDSDFLGLGLNNTAGMRDLTLRAVMSSEKV